MAKILLIEDAADFARAVKMILENNKFKAVVAANGENGILATLSENPDLILLDLLLPEINGFEVLKKLKSKEKTKNIPVIILSNLGGEEDIKKGLSLGAASYFIKTRSSSADLIAKIKEILGK